MNRLKKYFSLILVGALLFMSGCSKTSEDTLNEIEYVNADDPWYDTVVYDDLYDGNNGSVIYDDVIISTSNYYVQSTYSGWGDYENRESYNHLLKYDYKGNILADIDVDDQDFSSGYQVNQLGAYSFKGDDYFVFEFQDFETYEIDGRYVYRADYDSATLIKESSVDFSSVWRGYVSVLSIDVSGDDIVYAVNYHDENGNEYYGFYVIDSNNSYYLQFVPESGDGGFYRINPLNRISDAKTALVYFECFEGDNSSLYSFDPSSKAIKCVNKSFDSSLCFFLGDGSYLDARGSKITRIDSVTNKEIEVVADLFCSSISPSDIFSAHIEAFSEGTLLLIMNDTYNSLGYQRNKMCLVSKASTNPHQGKQIIKVGYVYNFDSVIGRLIEKNNGTDSSEYYVKITDEYSLSRSSELSLDEAKAAINDKLISDIRSGSGPDIMISGIEFATVNPEAIYVDLSPYMKNDSQYNRDDYLPVVFDAFEQDGGVYHMPYAVSLCGISYKDDLRDGKGFTYSEYTDFINDNNRGMDPIGLINEEDNAYFDLLFSVDFNEYFVDGRFDISSGDNGKRFEQTANYVKNRNHINTFYDGMKVNYVETTGNFYGYVHRTMMNPGDPLCAIAGLPSYEQTGCYTNALHTVAITRCCGDKDAAWKVVGSIMGYDVQSQIYDNCSPVRIDAIKEVTKTQLEVIQNGKGASHMIWYHDGLDLKPFEDKYLETIMNMTKASYADANIMLIINEEMPAFFTGQKSLSDVTSIIENRVNLYLEEVME